jgi:hypothetical protein
MATKEINIYPFWEEKSWSKALLKDDDEYLEEHEDSEEVYPR